MDMDDNWDEVMGQLSHTTTVPDAVTRWQGDSDSIRHIATGVNAVFRFEKNGEGYYLRIAHDGLIDPRKVTSALRYLHHLWREGAPVCEPVASRQGRMLEYLPQREEAETLPPAGRWMATVTREVAGSPLGLDQTNLAAFEAWGRCMALLHRAARTYSLQTDDVFGRSIAEQRADWAQSKEKILAHDALALQEYERLNAWRQGLPDAEDHPDYGLIHGDTNPRNFIWDGRTVTAIDFDEPHGNWFAADVSGSLISFMWKEQRRQFREHYLRGYRSVHEFSTFWESSLPYMMRMSALGYYLGYGSYATPGDLAEADREDAHRPWDFAWCCRRRFANPTLWL